LLSPFLVHNGPTGIDQHITDWFAGRRTTTWSHVMGRVTWLGSSVVVIPITVLTTIGLGWAHRGRLAAFVVVTVTGAALVNSLAKDFVGRNRPPAAVRLQHPHASSFPSGHSTQAAATYVALGIVILVLTRSRVTRVISWTLLIGIVIAVGVSRVYLGVHWTTDVIAGWIVGTAWTLGVACAFGLLAPQRAAGAATVEAA
jgi:Membrane-associated phospholipid phosphatase